MATFGFIDIRSSCIFKAENGFVLTFWMYLRPQRRPAPPCLPPSFPASLPPHNPSQSYLLLLSPSFNPRKLVTIAPPTEVQINFPAHTPRYWMVPLCWVAHHSRRPLICCWIQYFTGRFHSAQLSVAVPSSVFWQRWRVQSNRMFKNTILQVLQLCKISNI